MLANTETQDRLNAELLEAVALGDTARMRELLSQGADPAHDDSCALCWAAQDGRLDVVQMLLDDGRADPSADESACLRLAAEHGHTETVRLLLENRRADPADKQSYALRWACAYGHTDVVHALLKDGRADPNARNGEPLRFAADQGYLQTVRALLQNKGVDPAADDSSALRYAAESGRTDVVHALLGDGRVDPSARQCYAFRHAAMNGDTHILCFLLASAPDHARLPLAERLLELRNFGLLPASAQQFLLMCNNEPMMPRVFNIVRALLQTDTPAASIFALASEAARRNMSPEMVLQLHARGVLHSVLRTTLGPPGRIPSLGAVREQRDLRAFASVSKAEPMLQIAGWQLDPAQFPDIIFELAPTLAPQVAKAIWDTLRAQARGEEPARAYGTPAQRLRDRMAANILLTAAAREFNAFIADVKDDAYDKDPAVAAAAYQLLSALNGFTQAVQHADLAALAVAQTHVASNMESYARLVKSDEGRQARPAQRFALVRSIVGMPVEQLVELARVQARQPSSRKRIEIAL